MSGDNEEMNGDMNFDQIADSLLTPASGKAETKPNASNRASEADLAGANDEIDEADFDDLEGGGSSNELDEDMPDEDEGETSEEGDDQADDPDEAEYDVVVDGQASKAKLKDLKSAYSGSKAIEARLQSAGEFRKQSEVMTVELMKGLNIQAEKLKRLDNILAEAEDKGINWEELRKTDPNRYLLERENQREIQAKRELTQRTMRDTEFQKQELFKRQQQEWAANEAQNLVRKLPELNDPVKATKMSENWNKTASHYGFKSEEVAGIIDHRMLLVLTDAMKYRALVDAKAARGAKGNGGQQPAKRVTPKPLLRPGTNNVNSRNMTQVKNERAAAKRAAQTGSIDDVAASLLVAPKRQVQKRTGF